LRTTCVAYTYYYLHVYYCCTADDYNSYCQVSDGVGGKSRRAKGIDAAWPPSSRRLKCWIAFARARPLFYIVYGRATWRHSTERADYTRLLLLLYCCCYYYYYYYHARMCDLIAGEEGWGVENRSFYYYHDCRRRGRCCFCYFNYSRRWRLCYTNYRSNYYTLLFAALQKRTFICIYYGQWREEYNNKV